jgi:hypothetical protein
LGPNSLSLQKPVRLGRIGGFPSQMYVKTTSYRVLSKFTPKHLFTPAYLPLNRNFHGYFASYYSGVLYPFMCDTFYNVIREMR